MEANRRAPSKGGIPSLLAIERSRPALPVHEWFSGSRVASL